MLMALTLSQFALIEHDEIVFDPGFNVITGETGAGKSLILDALSLCVGGRGDSGMVRHGAKMAEIFASFELDEGLQTWFEAQGRPWCDGELLIRRQLTDAGRSKAWINGQPASLAELKSLGGQLLHIHSQHSGLALLKPQFAIDWLDAVGGLTALKEATKTAYHHWQRLKQEATELSARAAERQDRIELLASKVSDVEPFLVRDMTAIEHEYDELSNLEELITSAMQASYMLNNDSDEPSASDLVAKAMALCEDGSELAPTFAKALERLTDAIDAINDAAALLYDYGDRSQPDPERLDELNTLMASAHRLSQKYRTPIGELVSSFDGWQAELDVLTNAPDAETLQAQVKTAFDDYVASAERLHEARVQVAPGLSVTLQERLAPLALPNASCEFVFSKKSSEHYNAVGLYDIELMFSANVGMPKQPLHKIASGGELSRMALTMQVLAAGVGDERPLLVFDEVDVGISGGTAQVVGEMLRSLGCHQQLIAITHQAQVAAAAHQHLWVHKDHGEHTQSQIVVLDDEARIDELARMSGGVDITHTTKAHAKSLLDAIKVHE